MAAWWEGGGKEGRGEGLRGQGGEGWGNVVGGGVWREEGKWVKKKKKL